MAKTSIHITSCKHGATKHNCDQEYRATLDYVREDLTYLNQYEITQEYSQVVASIKEKYDQMGVLLQKKATPIREGVVVIKEDTTMEQLKHFASECEKTFGIRCFQIAIHKDEGHWKVNEQSNKQEWKPNLHAHMVFDWTKQSPIVDGSRQIICRIDQAGMRKMQDMLALSLGMEHGESSSKTHASALQYKIKQMTEDIETYQNQASNLHDNIQELLLKNELIRQQNEQARRDYMSQLLKWLAEKLRAKEYAEKLIEKDKIIKQLKEICQQIMGKLKDLTSKYAALVEQNKGLAMELKESRAQVSKLTIKNATLEQDHKESVHNFTGQLIDINNVNVDAVIHKHYPTMDIQQRRIRRQKSREARQQQRNMRSGITL